MLLKNQSNHFETKTESPAIINTIVGWNAAWWKTKIVISDHVTFETIIIFQSTLSTHVMDKKNNLKHIYTLHSFLAFTTNNKTEKKTKPVL